MSDIGVRAERRGAVAIWTLDRAERLNALSRAVVRELWRLARQDGADPAVRAVVITGAGDKAFSAGAEPQERQTMNDDEGTDFLSLYRVSFGANRPLPQPD